MKILVNGREAVLKANASFEYVSENPLFTEAEDYTMEIPFPMKDCPQNISIFGPLHVKGVDISKVSFPCEIQTDAFVKSGILTITSVSDTEVKGQFLEGMSQQNFASSLPDVYLTDLDFSQWDAIYLDEINEAEWAAIPTWDSTSQSIILPTISRLKSYRIYLHHLIKLVANAIGYSIDMDVLLGISMFQHIVVANARRYLVLGRNSYERPLHLSLPHWTIKEFFNQIALFFGCIVSVQNKHIAFISCKALLSPTYTTVIDVLDDFTIECQKSDSKYRGNQSIKLPDDCNPDKINACQDALTNKFIPHYNISSADLFRIIQTASLGGPDYDTAVSVLDRWYGLVQCYLYYITDKDWWVIVSKHVEEGEFDDDGNVPVGVYQIVEVINQYNTSEDGIEVKVCPCIVEGMVQSSPRYEEFYNNIPSVPVPESDPDEMTIGSGTNSRKLTPAKEVLAAGKKGEDEMYFDKLFLVIYQNGKCYTKKWEPIVDKATATLYSTDGDGNVVEEKVTDEDGNVKYYFYATGFAQNAYTLSPASEAIQPLASLPKVDETKLYRYKFLAKTLPSPTSVFLIKGKRYACLKLTAQITVKGMSELVEGEFYEIID